MYTQIAFFRWLDFMTLYIQFPDLFDKNLLPQDGTQCLNLIFIVSQSLFYFLINLKPAKTTGHTWLADTLLDSFSLCFPQGCKKVGTVGSQVLRKVSV